MFVKLEYHPKQLWNCRNWLLLTFSHLNALDIFYARFFSCPAATWTWTNLSRYITSWGIWTYDIIPISPKLVRTAAFNGQLPNGPHCFMDNTDTFFKICYANSSFSTSSMLYFQITPPYQLHTLHIYGLVSIQIASLHYSLYFHPETRQIYDARYCGTKGNLDRLDWFCF